VPETPSAESASGPATALADPPQPPTTPPGSVAGSAPEPKRKRTGIIVAVVASLVAVAFLVAVVLLVMRSSGGSGVADTAATKAAFDSAMQKAGVTAGYPGQPVELTSVVPTGSHPFTATFSAEELAALLNTFVYEYDVAGTRIALRNASLGSSAPGVADISASINANWSTYSGSVTLPLTFASGRVSTTGVTALTAEGFPANDGQKAQAGSGLVDYFNAYLAAAPGLTIESASIGADGVSVTGMAPDSITFP
jgi:hypothetical protein